MLNTVIINSFRIFITKKKTISVGLFFLILMITGSCIFQDYGMNWDEVTYHNYGKNVYEYIFLDSSSDAGHNHYVAVRADQICFQGRCMVTGYFGLTHGPFFQLGLHFIEKLLHLEDTRNIFLMRHFVVFIIFGIGVFFFYLLCVTLFKDWKISLLGCLFFVLTPRIFSHAFFNSGDIATLSLFIISIYTLIRFFNQASIANAIFHGLSCAVLIDTRIVGILIPVLTFLLFMIELFNNWHEAKHIKRMIISMGIYVIILLFFVVLFWPVLWENPVNIFFDAYLSASNITWGANLLYFGQYIGGSELPWHYTPVWMGITTPFMYSIFFLLGIFTIFYKLLYKPKFILKDKDYIYDVIILIWLFLPIVVTIFHHSVLFDGWRHHFFVYPAFLIISIKGVLVLNSLFKKINNAKLIKIVSSMLIGIILSGLIMTGYIMTSYHPHQHVYFNFLAGKNMKVIKNRFELDYWGLSYKQALEYILKNDPGNKIKIRVANAPGVFNSYILGIHDRNRIEYVDNPTNAKYFLSNYRWHKEEYPYNDEFYSIKIDGAKIMVVYKLK